MIISAPFIRRPVATTLLTLAVALAGAVAFTVLPVSPLPQVDFPTIAVAASLPGASAEIMASSVAAPLERQFGHIAGLAEMTSSSSLGTTSITLAVRPQPQYRFRRARCGGGNQCRANLPAGQPSRQSDLSQGQSGRRADHDPRAHLGEIRPRQAVRRRLHRHPAEALADRGRGTGERGRRHAPLRARGSRPCATQQHGAHAAKRPVHAQPAEYPPTHRPDLRRSGHRGHHHQ